jgi:ABC-2 type transport system permease protein
MFPKLLTIARNTCIETVRQPIYSVLLWVMAGWLALSPSLAAFTLEHEGDVKVVYDVGLATLLLYGLLASVFSATSVITREIESFTVLTVVSKPVSRPLFLLGKYLGVCAAVLIGYCFLTLVLLMTVRHGVLATASDKLDIPVLLFSGLALLISLSAATFGNYVYGWHFPTALLAWAVPLGLVATGIVLFVSPDWKLQAPDTDFGDMQLIYAVLMTFCGAAILAAFAVALATRLSQVITLLVCAGVYVLGLLSDHLFGRPAYDIEASAPWFERVHSLAYGLVPNFQFFWAGDALTMEQHIPLAQVANVAAYAALYSLAVLSLGVALFETREVG